MVANQQGFIYSSAWGLQRCSFRLIGAMRRPKRVERAKMLAPRLNRNIQLITLIIKYTKTGTI